MVNKPLRILHLEDNGDYSDLVRSLLEREGLIVEIKHVLTRIDFETALAGQEFDVILADYLLPEWNGLEALRCAREKLPETPFLLVSGTIGEQAAIESLKNGATDYVLKHWPERLIPAIRRAVSEAEERHQRRRAETELVRRERYFRALTENALDLLTILDDRGTVLYNSPAVRRVLGYDPKDLTGTNIADLVHADDLPRLQKVLEAAPASREQTVTMELRFKHCNGAWSCLEAVGQNRLHDPEISGVIINLRDISDRKRAEESLRESEKQYRLIFDGNPNPTWVFDEDSGAFLEVNDAAVKHYGYSRTEFLGMTAENLFPPNEGSDDTSRFRRLAASGCSLALRHRKKEGSIIHVELKFSQIRFRDRPALLTIGNDVTERKRIEHRDAMLSKLGQLLSSATSPAEAASIIRAVADELFRWDVFTLDLYSDEQNLVFPILNVDTDRTGARFEIATAGQCKSPSGMASRVVAKGAELILRSEPLAIPPDAIPIGDVTRPSATLMLAPIRNRTRVIGILSIQSYSLRAYDQQDLSTLQTLADHCGGALERIRAEQALRESEQRFRDLFEGSPDAIFVEDYDGNVLDVNPAACRLHGLTRSELVGKNVSALVPPELRSEVERDFKALVEGRRRQVEGVSWTADGNGVPVEVRSNQVEYGGKPAVLLHVRDITERKLAEAALRSSEMLFHSVWENSVDGMRLTDEDGTIVAVNQAFCKLVGMTRAELEGKLLTVIYAETENAENILQKYRQRFRDRVIAKQFERRLTLRNGTVVNFEDTNSFVELRGQPTLLLGLFRDVTAQRQLEDQLRQSQKMEGIGQLAGGVAHDFNNILTVISGHASLLLTANKLSASAARSAQQIGQAANRAAALTRQLLAFSRRQVMQPRSLEMNELVSNVAKMLGRIVGEDIALQLNYSSQPALVKADAAMMEQVLLNLAVNSRDAMPTGGQLTIKVSVQEISSSHVALHPEARTGRFVRLSVIDAGCGIPPENIRRIFEPFFTTKEVGKGTGLGLATVYGIVKQHEGWIEVESQVGHGATFHVHLPSNGEPAVPAEEKNGDEKVRGGTETILVVEDEAPVRELVCHLLSGHGYKILQAESGSRAIEVWEGRKNQIDLVLTDLVMPDRISGRELAERLWSDRPKLKVIFTSGYSADVVGKDFVLQRGLNYLQKPYQPAKLAIAVRECLDSAN